MAKKQSFEWKPITADRIGWLYSDSEKDQERGCIGHLRGDFGCGQEFWTSWFDHTADLNRQPFCAELDEVVNQLRKRGQPFQDLSKMRSFCHTVGKEISDSTFGLQMETTDFQYFLRCNTRQGDYNFYLYCYDKAAQREFTKSEKTQSVLQKLAEISPSESGGQKRPGKAMER